MKQAESKLERERESVSEKCEKRELVKRNEDGICLLRNDCVLQTGCKGVGSDIDRKWSGMSMNYCWLLVEPFRLPKGFRL